MAVTPLILKGQLKIGGVDVSDEVTHFRLLTNTDTITIPATLATPKAHKGGATMYSIEVNYLATDGTDGVLFPALWAAVGTASKELTFEGYMRDGGASVTNPKYTGTLVVSGAELGGDVESLSQGSATFPLTGAWVKATS